MRIRRKKWAVPELMESKIYVKNPQANIGRWKSQYNNENNKFFIELGCGKGSFIAALATQNPDVNFLAIDMISNMLGVCKRACEKEYALMGMEPNNILLTIVDIQRISTILNEKDVADRIYINFCNPWNKPQQHKKRLTHERQLAQYRIFLKQNGEIHFKTDDDVLFEKSLEYFKNQGFEIVFITRDLHNSDYCDNIETEHEKMFSEQGVKIKFVIVKLTA